MKKRPSHVDQTHAREGLFHPFDVAPPESNACLDRLYDLFADYPISWGWCLQCFGVDWEERMRAHPDVRTAPNDAFDMIYFEHPNCSGGETTFLHWLPRGLELSFLDNRLYPDFTLKMLQLGLLAWPAERLQALRDLFCRVAINWFIDGHVSPLQRPSCNSVWDPKERDIGPRLVEALCAVRSEARSITSWLLGIDTPTAWYALIDLARDHRIVEQPGYYALPDSHLESKLADACDALDRRARSDFFGLVTKNALVEKWERTFEHDTALANAISDAETKVDAYRLRQNEAERAEDERTIRSALFAE